MDITFVELEERKKDEACLLVVTDQLEYEVGSSENIIYLVEREPESDRQISKLQRFSFVYAQIIHRLAIEQNRESSNKNAIICVICPGSEEKRNGISLALTSCLAERWDCIAYMNTEGVDINDRILDSPKDEGFTRLFLNVNRQAVLTNFSYQHSKHFYFLGSSRSRRDKRSIGKEDYLEVLQRFREEQAFDYLVIELSQELNPAEIWLMTQAETLIYIRGASIYEKIKWEETLKRLGKECPSLPQKCLYLNYGQAKLTNPMYPGVPEGAGVFQMEEIPNLYRETSIGVEFDPERRLMRELQPFVDYMLERMML
jgi:hypothetical protein